MSGKRRGKSRGNKEWFKVGVSLILKMLPLIIFSGLGLILFSGLRDVLYADPALTVRQVTIVPSGSLTAQEKKIFESKARGKSIFRIDLRRIAEQLEREPEILKVRVQKIMPDSLTIDVEKRRPFAFVQSRQDGNFAIVSQDGIVLDTVFQINYSLILIEAVDSPALSFKKGAKIYLNGYPQCVKFLYSYWESPFSKQEEIEKIKIDQNGNITLMLMNGPEIRMGDRAFENLKGLQQLNPVLKSRERSKIDYIDLEYTEIVVKKKDGV